MLEKKVAVVTGASRGIGRSIAKKLSKDGYRVLLIARNRENLLQLAFELGEQYPDEVVFNCDLSNKTEVKNLINKIKLSFTNIQVLVNNAGYGGDYITLDKITSSDWDNIWDININCVMHLMQLILPMMKESMYGRIINISSILGLHGGIKSAAYSASKHAVIGLTKSIAAEWGKYNITCNAICPGYVDTDMSKSKDAENVIRTILPRIPAGRIGKPDDVANLVSFLIEKKASYINGGVFVVDGGFTANINELS
jgi:3-oxoacyl-[acyl-carrier protein] reductase